MGPRANRARIPELIAAVSNVMTLEPGDLLLTGARPLLLLSGDALGHPRLIPPRIRVARAASGAGTPAGVGAVKPGDIVTAGLGDGIAAIRFPVVAAPAPQNLS